MDRTQILNELKEILAKLFEVDPDEVTHEARLYEDLDLDSIDAVDLIVHVQEMTQRKFNPEEFKSVKTVNDVIVVIEKIIQDKQ